LSKWNPIERKLFSHISNNWAGVPLRTWDTRLAFIRGTTTAPGLIVQAIFQVLAALLHSDGWVGVGVIG
jgi:hypothetical protein